ncbi:MAG: DUF72 domain-containing protein [Chitinophagaceae bacterium]|nr:MAG: DUF72 domain-containing protein [Chitinophagaceae bacterium]
MAKRQKGRLFIGTSNVVVPGNKLTFPEEYKEKTRLHYYASLFTSVEVNSSFYKLPLPSTFKKWSEDVNPGFRFSFKASKTITHCKDLNFQSEDIPLFLDAAQHAGETKGPILIQFPGKITVEYYNKVESILEQMGMHSPDQDRKLAVEFRHPSWYVREVEELLLEHDATMVLQDIPKSRRSEPIQHAPFIYIRMHGIEGNYRGSYDDSILEGYAGRIRKWAAEGLDVYCYFNNTMGAAFENARSLQAMLNIIPGKPVKRSSQ